MSEIKHNNDFITSADHIMASADSTFVTRTSVVTEANYTVKVNKDLVGEPLQVGIYDELTGKIVEPLTAKEISAIYTRLDGLHTAVNKKGSDLTSKVTKEQESAPETVGNYKKLVSAQTELLTATKSALDEKQSSLTREDDIIFTGKFNSISATLDNLEKEFDAAVIKEKADKAKKA